MPDGRRDFDPGDHLIILGMVLAASSWIIESLLHVILTPGSMLMEQILTKDPHEIVSRSTFAGIVMAFSIIAQVLVLKRKKAEIALQADESKYRTFVETLTDIVFAVDSSGRFSYVNPRVVPISGYRPEDLINKPFQELIAPRFRELTLDRFTRCQRAFKNRPKMGVRIRPL